MLVLLSNITHFNRMNSDAQVEINMFLRATEMNQANINLGGFFDVNRTLFKSVSIYFCWCQGEKYFIYCVKVPRPWKQYHIFKAFVTFFLIVFISHLKIKLLATMVTYLVVLLQFQISIPTDEPAVMTTFITKNISYYES